MWCVESLRSDVADGCKQHLGFLKGGRLDVGMIKLRGYLAEQSRGADEGDLQRVIKSWQ